MSQTTEIQTASIPEIAEFYDNFGKRLIRDYVYGNPRVAAAVDRVCNVIKPTHERILDVGCGIGTSASLYKERRPWVSVHAVDISATNISIAKRLFERPGIEFEVSAMERAVDGGPFDVVALIDVYEHIPRANWPLFNRVLSESLSPKGVLVLTTPSLLHQAYLAEHNPQGLQIVDETVELEDVLALRDDLRGILTCYHSVGIWHTNDYVHVVIDRDPTYQKKEWIPDVKRSLWQKVHSRLINERRVEIKQRRKHVKCALGLDVE